MSYYEELGIKSNAEMEEIRKAHRRLVKLVHPDQQPDPQMKVLAETQLRRLNIIVATLLDPVQRGAYDEALRGKYLSRPVSVGTWPRVAWWLAVSAAAGILTVCVVWVCTGHLGVFSARRSFAALPLEISHAGVSVAPPALAIPMDRSNTTSVSVRVPSAVVERPAVLRKTASAPKSTLRESAILTTLEGDWVYAPKELERRKAGFYAPEFINLNLSKQPTGGLQGHYNARYEVAGLNPVVSPEVSFQLAELNHSSRRFTWQSATGSRGTLSIHDLDNDTIRIEWRTTVSSGPRALTSGIATLMRRQ